MPQVILEAPDIHCIQSIQKPVTKLHGVTFVAGDPAVKQVTLDYDPGAVSMDQTEGVMEEEGYPVKK
jgi:copper chaperone CopZ